MTKKTYTIGVRRLSPLQSVGCIRVRDKKIADKIAAAIERLGGGDEFFVVLSSREGAK